jgi:hypothetical protein
MHLIDKNFADNTLCCVFFQENVLALDKRLDHMAWKTSQMEKQMDDWDREQGTMDRLTSNTQRTIDELTLVSLGLKVTSVCLCVCVC